MKSRRQNVSDSLSIPIDLIIDIFLNLPAKSIARFRCVSKLWASLLRRKDFTELYLPKSSARPQLLVACQTLDELFFFSAHQPQNPDENSSVVIANRLAHLPCHAKLFAPVNGFFCLSLEDEKIFHDKKYTEAVSVICNPSTRQSFTLPKLKTKRRRGVGSYIGYDPIKKQFKVLSMTWLTGNYNISEEHQVLTLGTDAPSWKMVECDIPHYPRYDAWRSFRNEYGGDICIDGVLYYQGKVNKWNEVSMIVCFDFKSERFSVIQVKEIFKVEILPHMSTLINYNGKLGLLMSEGSHYVTRTSGSFKLWVLEDGEKQKWSNHTYVLPTSWMKVVGETELYFVGIIGTNEIVLAPHYQSMHYQSLRCYVFYYNIKNETIKKVLIQGLKPFKGCYRVKTFLNYVDNVMLIPEL